MVRGVDGGGLQAREVEELPVAQAGAELPEGAGCALVAVGADRADQFVVGVEWGEVHAPRVDGDGDGVGVGRDGLAQPDDGLLPHGLDVPCEAGAVAQGLVLETVDVGDLHAPVGESAGEYAPRRGSEVYGKYGGHRGFPFSPATTRAARAGMPLCSRTPVSGYSVRRRPLAGPVPRACAGAGCCGAEPWRSAPQHSDRGGSPPALSGTSGRSSGRRGSPRPPGTRFRTATRPWGGRPVPRARCAC